MKFSNEKKNSIQLYILEKIQARTPNIARYVSEQLNISRNTVHSYLSQMLEDGMIKKAGRGNYQLVTKREKYILERQKGDLDHDTYAYDAFLYPLIKHLPSNIDHIWSYGMSEMVNNVIDHSEAEHLAVIIEQNYLSTAVILIDDGIGIFKKIKDHFSLANLDEAICELFKGKLTTDAENHSGEGIFFTSKMMDQFFIYSDGKVFAATKYEDSEIFDLPNNSGGTAVFMSLSNFTTKKTAEIFDIYAGNDIGFTKTQIPLKNIFDKAPVSRSQAKRICNRLDQFKEVVLDFDGIAWMGQGFAHQLFVVYANAHPEIMLHPINMVSDVEKMYQHVIKTVSQ